jgi:hypothetical protein
MLRMVGSKFGMKFGRTIRRGEMNSTGGADPLRAANGLDTVACGPCLYSLDQSLSAGL